MEREEAEAKLKESQREQCNKFCPIILGNCKQSCVCYYKGIVKETRFAGEVNFIVHEACCTHVLISGEINTGEL